MITYEKYAVLRDSKGLKDADVARLAGVQPSTFSEWKKGKCTPKYAKMSKIAAALDMKYDDFVGESSDSDDAKDERAIFDRQLLRLFHNATPDAQTSVMTLLRNSQKKSSASLKEALREKSERRRNYRQTYREQA